MLRFASAHVFRSVFAQTALLVAAFFALPSLGSAAVLEATSSAFTGSDLEVSIQIDDESDPGNLVITLEVASADPTGDLRGFFAQVSDESLLSGLSVTGADISNSEFDANSVINLGGGVTVVLRGGWSIFVDYDGLLAADNLSRDSITFGGRVEF